MVYGDFRDERADESVFGGASRTPVAGGGGALLSPLGPTLGNYCPPGAFETALGWPLASGWCGWRGGCSCGKRPAAR